MSANLTRPPARGLSSIRSRTERRRAPLLAEARQNRRYALPHSASGRQGGFGNWPRFRRCSATDSEPAPPTRSRDPRALTCTFWVDAAGSNLRSPPVQGGAHAPLERTTKISIAYGPQTNLATELDPEEPRKRLLTSRFAVGAEGLEPPASAL